MVTSWLALAATVAPIACASSAPQQEPIGSFESGLSVPAPGGDDAPGSDDPSGTDPAAAVAVQPFKELVIVDSSVVTNTRADGTNDGHWSFRWLMEQMAPSGVDAGDFVSHWLSGLHVKSVNGFAIDDRAGTDALIASWPKRSDGRLDLGRAPLRLLAITNRVDITFGGNPGEARFVFGLVDRATSAGLPMTVIFEYRLPRLGTTSDRKEWARRFHALGVLPFGAAYNQKLQALTDAFAKRGANPGGVNGSALGQLRVNEIQLGNPWELREFHLNAATAELSPGTTAQNPDQSFNGSQALATFLIANAAAARNGNAVVPSKMLGGNAPETFTPWAFSQPGIDEAMRRGFAANTCNGCHNAETRQLDGFYHVTPLGGPIGASDGQSRLSDFVKVEDMPRRARFMSKLLGVPVPAPPPPPLDGGSDPGEPPPPPLPFAESGETSRVH